MVHEDIELIAWLIFFGTMIGFIFNACFSKHKTK